MANTPLGDAGQARIAIVDDGQTSVAAVVVLPGIQGTTGGEITEIDLDKLVCGALPTCITVASANIVDGTIVNADINNSAAIALSKLATGALPAGITVASTNLVDGTIVNADINSSAAIALSKLATGGLPTGITVASDNIVNGTIVNADINDSAAIALSKLSTGALPTNITVASANIIDGTIVDADISNSAAIALSKLATGALPSGITVASSNIVDGTIVNADISASASIADGKLATISSAGKVANSATSATAANVASGIVARNEFGNFSAGTITATLSGNATTATTLQTARTINGVSFNGSANISLSAPPSHSVYKTLYVSPEGNNGSTGRNEDRPVASIERALEIIEAQGEPAGWTVKLLGGVSTEGEIPVPDFTTIMSANMQRRAIITPSSGDEERNVFLCGNGVHLYGIKFAGWRIDDFDNPTKGFAMAFRPGAIILPGGVPYGQNCVVTTVTTEVPTPLPMNASSGNPAHPRGGGCVLADASVLSAYSVFPNIMTWGFTPAVANGMGYVARNRGFINPVNAIGVGAHRHFMCIDGGQMVVTGSSSQFGDYSFWSEGSTQRISPLKADSSTFVTQADAGTIIAGLKTTLIDDVWGYLVASYSAGSWPSGFEALTRKDSGLFLDALAASLVHGFERPMLNFAEGMFKFDGTCVYSYSYHDAFKASWDRLTSELVATNLLTNEAETMILALVVRLKATLDNYWYEEGSGAAPTPIEPVIRKLRSLITAINHQWTAPLSGVEYFRVPPARTERQIRRSIVQRAGGRVRFSGQDDNGNAVFVGGLEIDARSGQLGGPPFDAAIRGRVTRAVISRSY